MWDILLLPLLACIVLTGIHCYLGMHVIMREVIFVDLALAQIAALGAGAAVLVGLELHTAGAYVCSLAFTFLGAGIFALGRFRDRRVPQEAVIGIVYAVSAAATVLILSRIALEPGELEGMLIGRLLFVTGPEVAITALIYAAVGTLHILFRRPFFTITRSADEARKQGISVPSWDFVFYATFGLVVTSSVQIAGVLLVFSYLVIPAVCAMMFFSTISRRLLAGWFFGLLGSAAGLLASARWDLPTGAAIVTAFGVLWAICCLIYSIASPRTSLGLRSTS